MLLKAHIQAIYIASTAGAKMQSIDHIKVNAGSGIAGDRYALGVGAYSKVEPAKVRHISLISSSGIETANNWLRAGDEHTFDGSETRRNIVIDGITATELNDLVGKQFQLGKMRLLGTELCTPCERPAHLQNKLSFIEAFEGRGGIRAQVLNSGTLTVGDKLTQNEDESHD
jgi:hypothetical protein